MNRRALIALVIAGTAPVTLAVPSAGLAGGGAPQTDWGMRISVVGPGLVNIPGIGAWGNVIDVWVGSSQTRTVTLTPNQEGNGAEFSGWLGACEPSGLGPCTITMVDSRSADCLWVGARFERALESTPTLASPCETSGGGGSGGGSGSGAGGSGGSGGAGGSGSGGAAPLPAPGTALQGGTTVVRNAPSLGGAQTSVRKGSVKATGKVPKGNIRIVQSLVFMGQQGVVVAGRCTIARSRASFTCSAKPPKGKWRVITQAKRGNTVVAQSSAVVTVR